MCHRGYLLGSEYSGLNKGVYEVHPDPIILKWAQEMGCKLTIGSDSHRPEVLHNILTK